MGFSSMDSFIIAFSTRDPRSGGIAARRCFILGHPDFEWKTLHHIDNGLVMNNHVDSVYRKCVTKLTMLYKIRSFISRDISLLMYKTVIRPYMDYGDFIIDSAHSINVEKLDVPAITTKIAFAFLWNNKFALSSVNVFKKYIIILMFLIVTTGTMRMF